MLRRDLTKIEIKLEDLEELENVKNAKDRPSTSETKIDSNKEALDSARTKDIIEARIGYNPRPRRAN
jgi:hypothetical protein